MKKVYFFTCFCVAVSFFLSPKAYSTDLGTIFSGSANTTTTTYGAVTPDEIVQMILGKPFRVLDYMFYFTSHSYTNKEKSSGMGSVIIQQTSDDSEGWGATTQTYYGRFIRTNNVFFQIELTQKEQDPITYVNIKSWLDLVLAVDRNLYLYQIKSGISKQKSIFVYRPDNASEFFEVVRDLNATKPEGLAFPE